MILLVDGGWFGYQEMNDHPYEGMSIIPEQHDNIPLFKGLIYNESFSPIK